MSQINKIEFVALRDNLGATGGPGGVLYIQKQLLGNELHGIPTSYRFNYIRTRNVRFSSLRRVLNMFLFFFHFLFQRKTFFIAHDVETGSILAILHKRYSLIFHHQGSVVKERIELAGRLLPSKTIKYFQYVEHRALTNAFSLHFPSNGAAQMYFSSDYATCSKDDVCLGAPLYNVILEGPVKTPPYFPLKHESESLTFFSLGSLTKAKGQDQTIEFIAEFLPHYKGAVRYIIVGSGPLKDLILSRLNELKSKYDYFTYFYFERLNHDDVMFVHKLSDIYIMLHRVSIFDFATLEAMSQESAVILSKVGGNPEYCRDNNVIFAEDAINHLEELSHLDFEILKKKNKAVFDKYFSVDAFKAQYEELINSCILDF